MEQSVQRFDYTINGEFGCSFLPWLEAAPFGVHPVEALRQLETPKKGESFGRATGWSTPSSTSRVAAFQP